VGKYEPYPGLLPRNMAMNAMACKNMQKSFDGGGGLYRKGPYRQISKGP
jgi:hypothetical protein